MGSIVLILYKKTRGKPMGIGAALFLVTYIPFSKLFILSGEFVAERWMYTPSIGLALIASYGIVQIMRRYRYVIFAGLGILFCWYTVVIFQRNRMWLTEESLFRQMTIDAPNSVSGHLNIARLYLLQNRYEEAEKPIQRANEIYPNHALVASTLALVAMHKGEYAKAEQAILRSIELQPSSANYYVYARILTKSRKFQQSINILKSHLAQSEHQSFIRQLLAVNYYQLGLYDVAYQYFDWNTSLSEEEKIRVIQEL